MKDDIKLPPLPYPQIPGNDYDSRDMRDYARSAIAPYKKRITELEADLEAIGAGGVSARRITSTPSSASANITERSQAYLDSNLDADEHEAFIKWVREAHDYPDYARLILDSEWCQGAVAGWQGAIEADRQQRGEPSDDAVGVLKLALEYWADRQQRYRNRAPVWVQEARTLLDRYGDHHVAQKRAPDPMKYDGKRDDLYVTGWNDCVATMLAAAPKFGEEE